MSLIGYEAAKALVGPQAKVFLKLMDERLAALEGAEWGKRIKTLEDKLGEERGSGGGNLLTVIKESFSGSESIIKTFSEDMHGFFLSNDGTGDITFVINEDSLTIKAGEVFEGNFDAFNIVNITSNGVPFRAYSSALMDGGSIDRTAPNPVTNLTIGNIGSNSIEVLWTPSTSGDVMNYEVSYSLDGTRWTIASNSINAAYTSFVIPSLYPETYYMVRVVAIDTSYNRSSERLTSGNTAPPDMIAPDNPGTISSQNITEKSLTLKWFASPSKDVVAYEVYQNNAFIGESNGLSFAVTDLLASTSYTFIVKAKDGSGNISTGVSYTVSTVSDTFTPTVTISPIGGSYNAAQNITLTADEPATIYYTLNGSNPTTASTVYSAPIPISSTVTLKYFAKDTAGNSSVIQSATYTIDITAPNDVTNVTGVNVGERSLTVTWTASTSNDVASYDVYNGATLVGTTASTSYDIINLIPNTAHTFKVVAKDLMGNTSIGTSAIISTLADTTAPNEVAGLAATAVTMTSLTLVWNASTSSDIASYDVYNGTTLLGNTTNTTYNVSGLTHSTAYTFVVKSKDTYGNASTGSSVGVSTAVPDTTPPNDVTNLQAINVAMTSLTLTWTASNSTDVAFYDVYQGSTLLGNTASTSYAISNLTASTSYTFTVKAKDGSGNTSTGVSKTQTTADPVMTVVASDNFNRADTSVNSVGIAQVGGAWSGTNGFSILNNQLKYHSAAAYLNLETWESDNVVIEVDVQIPTDHVHTGNICGLAVRQPSGGASQAFQFGFKLNSTKLAIMNTLPGSAPAPADIGFPTVQGQWYKLKIDITGNVYKCYVDGALKFNYTDTNSSGGTNTRHGLNVYNATGAWLFDNFKVSKK